MGFGLPKTKGWGLRLALGCFSELVSIKGMEGLAVLQHHQIGDVDHVVNGSNPSSLQALLQPAGGRAHLHPLQLGHGEEATGLHGGLVGGLDCQRCSLKGSRGITELGCAPHQGGDFPGNPPHREAIGPVGGDRQFQNLVIEAQAGSHGTANGGHAGEKVVKDCDPLGFAEAQLGERANHSATGYTAQFRRLNREIHGRQGCAYQGHGNMDSRPHIGRTADNL